MPQSIVQDLVNYTVEFLLPTRCVACKNIYPQSICTSCLTSFSKVEEQVCIVCKSKSFKGTTHPECNTKTTPELVLTCYLYKDNSFDQAIVAGKYYSIKSVFEILGQELARFIEAELGTSLLKNLYLTPLPLHKQREAWRGFNQSQVLAEALKQKSGFYLYPALTRNKKTKVQKDLKKDARTLNVQDSFSLSPGCEVKNRNFLLVDDIITTGASFLEASKTLKKAGAKYVFCLALARE